MRCPECGAPGYRRKTKTPEWRCSRPYPRCGFEWDDAILELLEEEERRLNDQTELEAFRLEADGRKRQLRSEQEVRHRKEKINSGVVGLLLSPSLWACLLEGNLRIQRLGAY